MTAQKDLPAARTAGRKDSGNGEGPVALTVAQRGAMGNDTALATLDDYERHGKYNVLHPVVQMASHMASPVLEGSVSIRELKPGVDTYNDFRFANERDGKFALNGLALQKIASDAGIRWIESGVVEERSRSGEGHVYIRVRSTGAVLQPNGEHYLISARKEIDTADEEQRLLHEKSSRYRRENKLGPEDPVPPAAMARIRDDVRRDLLQIKQFLLPMAETKAQNRVIRKLLSLKQVYTKDELARPFVIPRLLYRPELTDPQQFERTQLNGARAAAALYGAQAPAPVSTEEEAGRQEAPPETPRQEAVASEGSSAATHAEASPSKPKATAPAGKDPTPTKDPFIEDLLGKSTDPQYKGMRISDLAAQHPDFVRGLMQSTRKQIRELATQWMKYTHPTLEV